MKPHSEYSKISIYLNKRPMSTARSHCTLRQSDGLFSEHTYKNLHREKDSSSFNQATFRLNHDSTRQLDNNEILFEECSQLKSVINRMNKEFTLLKSELIKKDLELLKLNEIFRNYLTETYQTNDFTNEKMKILEGNNLISNLKKEYNILKREFNKKDNELQEIKQGSKYIRLREFQRENQFLVEEIHRLKIINEDLLQRIDRTEISEINNINLKENYKKQACLLDELQAEIKVLKDALAEKSNSKDCIKNTIQYQFTLDKIKDYNGKAVRVSKLNPFESAQKIKSKNLSNFNFNNKASTRPFPVLNRKMKIKNQGDSAVKITNNTTASYLKEFNYNTNNTTNKSNLSFLMCETEKNSLHRSSSIMTEKQIKIYTILLLEIIGVNVNERNKFKEVKFYQN